MPRLTDQSVDAVLAPVDVCTHFHSGPVGACVPHAAAGSGPGPESRLPR